jgi:hypothetical protein
VPFTNTKNGPVVGECIADTLPIKGGDRMVSDAGHNVTKVDRDSTTVAACSLDTEIFDFTRESDTQIVASQNEPPRLTFTELSVLPSP